MVATLEDAQENYAELIAYLSNHNLVEYLADFSEGSQARVGFILNELLEIKRCSAHDENSKWAKLMLDCIRYVFQESIANDKDKQDKIEQLESIVQELKSELESAAQQKAS